MSGLNKLENMLDYFKCPIHRKGRDASKQQTFQWSYSFKWSVITAILSCTHSISLSKPSTKHRFQLVLLCSILMTGSILNNIFCLVVWKHFQLHRESSNVPISSTIHLWETFNEIKMPPSVVMLWASYTTFSFYKIQWKCATQPKEVITTALWSLLLLVFEVSLNAWAFGAVITWK